jgi:hypothetical protein
MHAMQVMLDQQPCDVAADSLWVAIAEASAIAQAKGRMIIEVIVDGTPLSDEEVSTLQQQRRSAQSVELTSANVGALVAEVFAEAEESLVHAEALQNEAAEKLQVGAQTEAMAKLSEVVTIWQGAQRALTLGMEAMDGNNETDAKSIDEAVARLRQQLDSICESLRQRDMIAMSDALLYELPECVQQWRTMLQSLRQRALVQAGG